MTHVPSSSSKLRSAPNQLLEDPLSRLSGRLCKLGLECLRNPQAATRNKINRYDEISALCNTWDARIAASSPQAQRALFSKLRQQDWNEVFVTAREVRDTARFPICTLRDGVLRDSTVSGWGAVRHVKEATPYDPADLLMQAFGAPDEYVYRRWSLDERGKPVFQPIAGDILGCLLQPDRIPNKLLDDIGFFDSSSMNGEQALAAKASSLVAINTVKAICLSASPFWKSGFRMMRIQQIPPEVVSELNISPLPPSVVGRLWIFRETHSGTGIGSQVSTKVKGWKPVEMTACVMTAYAAKRTGHYKASSLGQEVVDLQRLQAGLKGLVEALDTGWKRGAEESMKSAFRQDIGKLVSNVIEVVKSSTNLQKIGALTFMEDVQAKIAQESNRVGAMQAQLTAARERLKLRIQDAELKKERALREVARLESFLTRHHAIFDAARTGIEGSAKRLDVGRSFFTTTFNTTDAREKASQSFLKVCGVPLSQLDEIELQPFLCFAQTIQRLNKEYQASFVQRNQETTWGILAKMYVVARLEDVNHALEELRLALSDRQPLSLDTTSKRAERLATLLEARSGRLDAIKTSYHAAYEEVAQAVKEIKDRLVRARETGLDLGSRTKLYREIRALTDKIDIEGIVRGFETAPVHL